MKTCEFQDMDAHKIRVQYSGGGDVRIYIERKAEKGADKVDCCLHLSPSQSCILVNAIEDLLDGLDD